MNCLPRKILLLAAFLGLWAGGSVLAQQEVPRAEIDLATARPPRAQVVGETPETQSEGTEEGLLWAPTAKDVAKLFNSYSTVKGAEALPDLLAPPEAASAAVTNGSEKRLPDHLLRTQLEWGTNPFTARSEAVRQDKFLLLMFGGWDWSKNSSSLAWEVFSSKEFAEFADRELILCALDLPAKISDADEKAIRFKEIYRVKGLPYALLLDPSGEPFLRKGGYMPGKARSYLQDLENAVREEKEIRSANRQQLALRGYREWTGAHGHALFARLAGQEKDSNRLLLVDENGLRHAVNPANLGERDQQLVPHLLEAWEALPENRPK